MAKTYKPRGSALRGRVSAPKAPKKPSIAAAKGDALRQARRLAKGKF